MSTTAGIIAELDPAGNGKLISIIKEVAGTSTTDYYALGGTVSPGKARWTTTTNASSDATNAAAITANLAL